MAVKITAHNGIKIRKIKMASPTGFGFLITPGKEEKLIFKPPKKVIIAKATEPNQWGIKIKCPKIMPINNETGTRTGKNRLTNLTNPLKTSTSH